MYGWSTERGGGDMTSTGSDGSTGYILGHSSEELERLNEQARLIGRFTRRSSRRLGSRRGCGFWTSDVVLATFLFGP